jgi:hypothetical protein
MSLSAASIINTICPELSGSPSLPVYLGMAVEATDRRFFGGLYEQAVAYLASHLFTVMNISSGNRGIDNIMKLGGGASVASATEGKVSLSFAQSGGTVDASSLDSTKYGRILLGLKKSRPTFGVNCGHGPLVGGFGI